MSWLSKNITTPGTKFVNNPGKAITKGAGDIWDSTVNVLQQTNPVLSALTEGKVYGMELPGMGTFN